MDFELVQRAYPKEPLLVVGESFGAGIAAQVAGQHKASVCGVTLVTPWYSLADLAQESMPWFPVRHLLHRDLDSKEALLRYGGPVTVVGAALDAVIPVHHAQRLAQAVPGAQAVIIPEVGHNNWWVRATKADWERWLPKCPAVPKSAEPPANTDQPGIKPQ
jgi:pimeloyl-ACP methyl ester carboxylesterase